MHGNCAILPIITKLIERAVHNQLYNFLGYDLLNENQSGFRPAHSCETALLNMADHWSKKVDDGYLVGAAFIDLSKAFDTVDHSILLKKLELYGCSYPVLKWFASYLHDRRQFVANKGISSEDKNINIGVPQGSILGPLLFTLYINDLPTVLRHVHTDMYADDTTISVVGKNKAEIEHLLEESMKCVDAWLRKNRLVMNVKKTFVMLKS